MALINPAWMEKLCRPAESNLVSGFLTIWFPPILLIIDISICCSYLLYLAIASDLYCAHYTFAPCYVIYIDRHMQSGEWGYMAKLFKSNCLEICDQIFPNKKIEC